VCTNKPRITAELVLEGLGMSSHFAIVVAGGDLPRLKPDPLPLLTIAERLGVRARDLVMVGDGPQDVHCGRAAGAFTVGVEGGMTPRERLIDARPDALIPSMRALPRLLQSWGWLGAGRRVD
jgi:phosphoglycolate phosphatase